VPRKKKQETSPEVEETVVPAETPEETSAEAPTDAPSKMPEGSKVEDTGDAAATVGQVVVFLMDGQQYALPIEAVQEIQQVVDYTPVPGSVPALLGMIDLRGTVVPLIDLRLLLGLNAAPLHLDTPLIFGLAGGLLVAYVVDGVEDVADLSGQSLQAPSALHALSNRLTGVGRLGDGLLFVLDHHRLIPVDTLTSLGRIAEGGTL